MSAQADRNLLIGILALQLDFVTNEQLLNALHEWVRDKTRALPSILVEQNALDREAEPLLLAVVKKHLELHNNEVEKSLAAVSTLGSLADRIAAIEDPEIDATLPHVARARQDRDQDPQASSGPLTDLPPCDRYSILRPHAKGGLGEVSLARDEELRREVAVKLLQERYALDKENNARFMAEAEITGSLEHPGIVPVYGLGTTPDGRPFYAMRFIRGDSLRDAALAFHQKVKDFTPTERLLDLRKLLSRFIDVCEATSYAHSRGVLHRDLKPGNIMLGRFGETLVVDWGLAKSLGRSDSVSDEPSIHPSSQSGSAETQLGSAIGTPAYMSPEQAAGQIDKLGPATDVYGLGATLYFVLTGVPPVVADRVRDVLEKVRRGEVTPVCQVKEWLPRPLEAICSRAMALEANDRYPGPRELADDVERWLADASVSAYRESAIESASRWLRQHSTLVFSAAAIGIVAIAAGWGMAWLAENSRQRIANEKLRAEKSEGIAQRNFDRALEAVDQMLTRVGNERLAEVPFMTNVRKQLLEDALHFYQNTLSPEEQHLAPVIARTAKGHQLLGRNYRMLGEYQRALIELEKGERILEEMNARTTPDSTALMSEAGLRLELGYLRHIMDAQEIATQELNEALRLLDSLNKERQGAPEVLRMKGRIWQLLGSTYSKRGRTQDSHKAYDSAQTCLVRLTAIEPNQEETIDSLAQVEHSRAQSLWRLGDLAKSEQVFESALAKQLQLLKIAGEKPWYLADRGTTLMRLAASLQEQGRLKEAAGRMKTAQQIFSDLNRLYPKKRAYLVQLAACSSNLAEAYLRGSQLELAVQGYRISIEKLEELLATEELIPQEQGDLANSCMMLASIEARQGNLPEAEELMSKSVGYWKQCAELAPETVIYAIQEAAAIHNLADVRFDMGKLAEAEAGFRQSIALLEENDGKAEVYDSGDRANSWMRLAATLDAQDQYEEAVRAYQNAQQLFRDLRDDQPDNIRFAVQYPATLHNLAGLLEKMDRRKEAVEHYEQSIRLLISAEEQFPEIPFVRRDLASSYLALGMAQISLEQLPQAQATIRKSVNVIDEVLNESADSSDFQRLAASIHLQEALLAKEYERAGEIARKFAVQAKTPIDIYHAASLNGICLNAMKTVELIPEKLPALLRRRCVRLLTDCWQHLPLTSLQLLEDSDFTAMRGYPAFEQLVAEITADGKNAAETDVRKRLP